MIDETKIRAEKRARRFWVSLVVCLLGIQVVIGGVALQLAVGDPSGAVVPSYHEAALNWDQTHHARLASTRLGWAIETVVSDVADESGMRAIEIHVQNELAESASDLEIAGQIYHHARACKVQSVAFASVGEGRYIAMAPMARDGLWQLEFEIQGAGERMTEAMTLELPAR